MRRAKALWSGRHDVLSLCRRGSLFGHRHEDERSDTYRNGREQNVFAELPGPRRFHHANRNLYREQRATAADQNPKGELRGDSDLGIRSTGRVEVVVATRALSASGRVACSARYGDRAPSGQKQTAVCKPSRLDVSSKRGTDHATDRPISFEASLSDRCLRRSRFCRALTLSDEPRLQTVDRLSPRSSIARTIEHG